MTGFFSIFNKPAAPAVVPKAPYDIGRTGTPAEYLAESARLNKLFAHWETRVKAAEDLRSLYKGALQAFHEKRPETMQTIIADAELRKVIKLYERSYSALGNILLWRGDQEATAAVTCALEKTSEADRQQQLTKLLLETLRDQNTQRLIPAGQSESFVAFLLASGAKPAGKVVAEAVLTDAPFAVQKLLLDNGGSYDSALAFMKNDGWSPDYITRLMVYRVQVCTVAELKQQVQELTEEVKRLSPTAAPKPDPLQTSLQL